jgi:hypothetical protein
MPPEVCVYKYPALIWQRRAIGILVLVGLAFQAWPYFLALWALLWWNAALPGVNPFDALYNHLVAKPKGLPRARSGAESPSVRASDGGNVHARDRAVPILWLEHACVGF